MAARRLIASVYHAPPPLPARGSPLPAAGGSTLGSRDRPPRARSSGRRAPPGCRGDRARATSAAGGV